MLPAFKAPSKVSIELTTECSQRCVFCEPNIAAHYNFLGTRETMSLADYSVIASKLKSAGVVRVFLSGGEPSLIKDIEKYVKICSELGMYPTMASNGIALSKDKCLELREAGLQEIQIAIQAVSPDVDMICTGRKNAHIHSLKAMENVLNAGIRCAVATVVLKRNLSSLVKILDNIGSLGVKRYRLLRSMTYSEALLDERISTDEYFRATEKLSKAAVKWNLEIDFHCLPGTATTTYTKLIHPYALTCYAGKIKMDILVNGDVVPCRALRSNELICGNLIRDDVNSIWEHPTMRLVGGLTPDDYKGKCGSCERKWGCYSCRGIAYALNESIYGDDVSCVILNPPPSYNKYNE